MTEIKKVAAFCGLLLVCALSGCVTGDKVDKNPVLQFDVNRYLGTWYEIARFDNWFERGMTHTRAHYSIRGDGFIGIVNTGLKKDQAKTAIGKAKKTNIPGLLRVSFFSPFYADYRVLWIDRDYSCALVGGDNEGFLWILSRSKKIDQSTKNIVLAEAKRRGYDVSRFIWVEQ